MLGKTAVVLALTATCLALGVPRSLAGSGSRPAATAPDGWYDTYGNAANSQSNPAETVLSPSAVKKIEYLRSITAPPTQTFAACGPGYIASPLPYDGDLYAITSGKVSKYNPATGGLIWQAKMSADYFYESMAISGNLVIVAGIGCESASEPGGIVYALNASTGAIAWTSSADGGTIDSMVKGGSYVVVEGEDAAGYEGAVLDVTTGNSVWDSFSDCAYQTPSALVVGLLVMDYGCDSEDNPDIQAQNLATGAVAWSLSGAWTFQRGDLSGLVGQHLYATDPSGTVVDLNPQTGQTEYSLSQAVTVLAVDASRVYATCGSGGQYICAYAIGTGALLWQDTQLAPGYDWPTNAAEADGVLYLGTGAALNAATGQFIKELDSATALAVGDGRLAMISDPRVVDLYGLAGS